MKNARNRENPSPRALHIQRHHVCCILEVAMRSAVIGGMLTIACAHACAAQGPLGGGAWQRSAAIGGVIEGSLIVRLANQQASMGIDAMQLIADQSIPTPLRVLGPKMYAVEVLDGSDEAFAEVLRHMPGVVNVSRDYWGTLCALPNDPRIGDQWWVRNLGQTIQGQTGVAGADIGLWKVWDAGFTSSKDFPVAVFDTGVMFKHPDLQDNIWRNPEETGPNSVLGFDDDANGIIDDFNGASFVAGTAEPTSAICMPVGYPDPGVCDYGRAVPGDTVLGWYPATGDDYNCVNPDFTGPGFHGTACALIIGSKGNNGQHLAGVAWSASVMPIRITHMCQATSGLWTLKDVLKGMYYAAGEGAKVFSMSIQFPGDVEAEEMWVNAIADMDQADVLVVVSAGNFNVNLDTYLHPPAGDRFLPGSINAPNLLTVGASTNRDLPASFSSFGSATVDVFAPGEHIAVYQYNKTGSDYPPDFNVTSGTSFATPMVAGLAALYWQANPLLTDRQVAQALRSSCRPLPGFSTLCECGGVVHAPTLFGLP
jgi:subtilisin family serine protease